MARFSKIKTGVAEIYNKLTASEIKADSINTDQLTVNRLAVVVEKTTSQSISASTVTKLDWDQEVTDDNDEFDLANNQFVPSQDGDYHVNIGLLFTGNNDQDRRRVMVYKNGSKYRQTTETAAAAVNDGFTQSFYLHDLTTSDTIELYVVCADGPNSISSNSEWSFASFVRCG